MNIATALKEAPAAGTIARPEGDLPVFVATGPDTIAVRAGAAIDGVTFAEDTPVRFDGPLAAGSDYAIVVQDGVPTGRPCGDGVPAEAAGGFHFAPGGNATARAGGDDVPAINPCSIWDRGFRPACPDPRGMAIIALPDGRRSWIDIYKLGVDHLTDGTSRCGVEIADGGSLPVRIGGKGKAARLDFATAQEILAHHGKQLLTYDEFRVAAFGVTEKTAVRRDPKVTGLDAARTSRAGIMQATGNLWDWGTDGDPDDPRPSIFGGSWFNGGLAGSRCAFLGAWPVNSGGDISARGRSDHLNPA